MRIKTFYTKTMSEALREVKENLGPEAMILSTKEIPCRSGAWGRPSGFEVVAAIDNPDGIDIYSSARQRVAESIEQAPVSQMESREELAATYSPASIMHASLVTAKAKQSKPSKVRVDAETEIPDAGLPFKGRAPIALYQDLVQCGVDALLARDLLVRTLESLSAGQRRSRAALIRSAAQAAQNLLAPASNTTGMPGKKVVAFVGPTGVGKTTSIAKLAAYLALQKKKKVLLMTLDGYRIGAIEQLRIYAGLMGIPFRFVDHVSDLSRTIEENSQRDYILIDTAGHGPKDMGSMRSLAAFLKESQKVERHLVLSAATKETDMQNIMRQFEICAPDHLLFTKLDETATPGPILNELVRTRKSFSYYTDGQRVPDDLHSFPREQIIELLLNRNHNALKE
jgi:flagellar biosynthesis protein FlhF